MANIVSDLRCFGPGKNGYAPQTVPTVDQLIAAGASETGYRLSEYDDYLGKAAYNLAEGRDDRTWVLEDKSCDVNLVYVPDAHGFFLEDYSGSIWRPTNIDEAVTLVEEMAFQMDRYGELI